MWNCWTWVVVLLRGYLYFPFSTSIPELKRQPNTLRWAWWAQWCSYIQRCVMSFTCHVTSSVVFLFFSEFFGCFRISETKEHFPSWETLLTWNNLVINHRSAQKQPTSTPPCRWAASFGANSEDVLRDKGNLQTNYTREWKAALRWDKTLDVGSSDDLWAAENVLVCISYESFSSWWWSN